MRLSDTQLGTYVSEKLALPGDERNEYRGQVNRLLDKLDDVLASDGSYKIVKFRRAGSLEKGTSNRPRAGKPVDADVGVYFAVDDPNDFDVADLQRLIKELLAAAYPQKSPEDFEEGGRTFGVVFKGSGLEVDLVPIVALDAAAENGLQYSHTGACVKTRRQGAHRPLPRPRRPRPAPRAAAQAHQALAPLAGARGDPVVPPRADPELPRRPQWTGRRA